MAAIDAELIRRAANGDRAAFDRLYDSLFPIVWALSVQQVGTSVEDAERLTERLLERVVLSLDGHSRNVVFTTWLRRLLADEIRDFTRRPRRRRSASPRRIPLQPRA